MTIENLIIRPLKIADENAFKDALEDFKNNDPQWVFAFKYNDSIPFPDYIKTLEHWSLGLDLQDNLVPNTFLVGVVGKRIVGRLSIRHVLNDFLATFGGHVGYGVVPSERRKGYGTKLLSLALPIAASLGLSRLLVTCDDDNTGSRKIIEKNGGVFEGLVKDTSEMVAKRRYWIELR
jgi:predicted acetyltransferase